MSANQYILFLDEIYITTRAKAKNFSSYAVFRIGEIFYSDPNPRIRNLTL